MDEIEHMLASFSDHLHMLQGQKEQKESEEAAMSSLFTAPVFVQLKSFSEHIEPVVTQYGLLGGVSSILAESDGLKSPDPTAQEDPRKFTNTTTPFSVFICGSQGSGMSHTLSCILENCILSSSLNRLSSPLTALVFHYDNFISDRKGSPCEAAFLSSHPTVITRVLCSPTNVETIKV